MNYVSSIEGENTPNRKSALRALERAPVLCRIDVLMQDLTPFCAKFDPIGDTLREWKEGTQEWLVQVGTEGRLEGGAWGTTKEVLAGVGYVVSEIFQPADGSDLALGLVGGAAAKPLAAGVKAVGTGLKGLKELSIFGDEVLDSGGTILTKVDDVATNTVDDVVGLRIQQLTAEGHGVQRHGAGVTQIQLEGRSVQGLDPMTGTRVDGVHGGTHQYAQHATKVVSDEAYVFAENYARNSRQFIDATAASTTGRAQLEIPLSDIYGADFREFVYGVTRYGPKNSPTGFGNTVFSDNAYMVVRYKQDATGNWLFNTMFPQPH